MTDPTAARDILASPDLTPEVRDLQLHATLGQKPHAVEVTREQLIQDFSDAGAMCGDCGDEPGDRNCPHCEKVRSWYADAALARLVTASRTADAAEEADVCDSHTPSDVTNLCNVCHEPQEEHPSAKLRDRYTAAFAKISVEELREAAPSVRNSFRRSFGDKVDAAMAVGAEEKAAFTLKAAEKLRALQADLELTRQEKEDGYRDRALLLALLTTFLPAVTTPCTAPVAPGIDPTEEGWHLLYLTLDGEQLSFHNSPLDTDLFQHVEQVPDTDPRAQWDGHTTAEKWARIRAYIASGGNETIHLAVDVVAVRPDGRFLGIKRRYNPHKDKWALPGGHVKPGEEARDAAARELGEETGVPVDPAGLTEIGAFHRPGRDKRGRYVSIGFLARVPEDTNTVAGDDANNTAWLPRGSAKELAFDHRDIVTAALKGEKAL